MAIDSRQKRTSVANYHNLIMPVADGTIGTADKQHASGLYMGLSTGAPVAGGTPVMSSEGIHSTIFGGMVVH